MVRLAGELDLTAADQADSAIRAVETAGAKTIVLDLRELRFMDSTGLRVLLSSAREIEQLSLAGPLQAPVQRLLELTQTLTILPFEGN